MPGREDLQLALAGWRERGGSISVAGNEIWQVCDGANYAGNCRVVSNALRRSVHAQSARRLSPAQATFGVMLLVRPRRPSSTATRTQILR